MFESDKAHEKDGTELWLDENVVSASTFLAAMHMAERKRELTDKVSLSLSSFCTSTPLPKHIPSTIV